MNDLFLFFTFSFSFQFQSLFLTYGTRQAFFSSHYSLFCYNNFGFRFFFLSPIESSSCEIFASILRARFPITVALSLSFWSLLVRSKEALIFSVSVFLFCLYILTNNRFRKAVQSYIGLLKGPIST